MDFLVQLMNGLQAGSIYALVALGYTMVYGIVKLINFAHGDIIMVGAYTIFFSIVTYDIPIWIAILLAMLVCATLGMVIEKIAYKPLRGAPRISPLITAIGVSLLLQNLALLLFKPDARTFPLVIDTTPITIGEMLLSPAALYTIAIAIVLMIILEVFIKKTKMGKAMRAVSEDAGAATLMGININTTISVTFAIGSALAAVGGALYAISYTQIDPLLGSMLGLKAFVAAVLGGIGRIPGAILGGFVLGISESMTKAYISSQLTDAVVFSILILVLLVKPSGILGKHVREKV